MDRRLKGNEREQGGSRSPPLRLLGPKRVQGYISLFSINMFDPSAWKEEAGTGFFWGRGGR